MDAGEYRPPQPAFVDDGQILEALKQPRSIDEIACRLRTNRQRCKDVLGKHKAEVLKVRIETHNQIADQIAYQLDLVCSVDALREWFKRNYGDETE